MLNSLAANQQMGIGLNSMIEGSNNMSNLGVQNELMNFLKQQNLAFACKDGKTPILSIFHNN
jgi:hypothetical protein